MSTLKGPFQDDGLLSLDYAVRDYGLLERRYKHSAATDDQQGAFEAGWEAAISHYADEFKRPSKGNVRKVDAKGRISIKGFIRAGDYTVTRVGAAVVLSPVLHGK